MTFFLSWTARLGLPHAAALHQTVLAAVHVQSSGCSECCESGKPPKRSATSLLQNRKRRMSMYQRRNSLQRFHHCRRNTDGAAGCLALP
jgi:hypothetical protein